MVKDAKRSDDDSAGSDMDGWIARSDESSDEASDASGESSDDDSDAFSCDDSDESEASGETGDDASEDDASASSGEDSDADADRATCKQGSVRAPVKEVEHEVEQTVGGSEGCAAAFPAAAGPASAHVSDDDDLLVDEDEGFGWARLAQ